MIPLPRAAVAAALGAALLLTAWRADAAPTAYSATGASAADIQATVDAFRTALGDPNNGDAAGSQPARMQWHRNHQLRRRWRQARRRLEDQHACHGLRRRVEPREPGSRVLEAVDPRLDGPAELRRGRAGRERRGG